MRGQVLGVDVRTGEGQIAGDDGRRYTFRRDDWAHAGAPSIGLQVDFEAEDRGARSIFPIVAPSSVGALATHTPGPDSDRNKIVAALLAFFLGTLGIHRFYLGRTDTGVLMLILSITVVGLLVSAPWALIDAVRYLLMSDREFAARYARH